MNGAYTSDLRGACAGCCRCRIIGTPGLRLGSGLVYPQRSGGCDGGVKLVSGSRLGKGDRGRPVR